MSSETAQEVAPRGGQIDHQPSNAYARLRRANEPQVSKRGTSEHFSIGQMRLAPCKCNSQSNSAEARIWDLAETHPRYEAKGPYLKTAGPPCTRISLPPITLRGPSMWARFA